MAKLFGADSGCDWIDRVQPGAKLPKIERYPARLFTGQGAKAGDGGAEVADADRGEFGGAPHGLVDVAEGRRFAAWRGAGACIGNMAWTRGQERPGLVSGRPGWPEVKFGKTTT